jgi:hypothetical protein
VSTEIQANHTARREGESLRDAAVRNAIDAVYAARDSGGTMHDAGERAADAVLSLFVFEHMGNSDGAMSIPPQPTDRPMTYSRRLVGPWERAS